MPTSAAGAQQQQQQLQVPSARLQEFARASLGAPSPPGRVAPARSAPFFVVGAVKRGVSEIVTDSILSEGTWKANLDGITRAALRCDIYHEEAGRLVAFLIGTWVGNVHFYYRASP